MEARTAPRLGAGSILGLVGGASLALGSFLTWATATVNVDAVAEAFGVDPTLIPAGSIPGTSTTFNGFDGSDGTVTLLTGVLVIVGAIVVWAMDRARVAGAALMLVAGLGGGGLALLDATVRKDDAVEDIAARISAAGLPGDARDLFDVSIGLGLWMCVAGGAIAVVAGIVALASRSTGRTGEAVVAPGGAAAPVPFETPPPPGPTTDATAAGAAERPDGRDGGGASSS